MELSPHNIPSRIRYQDSTATLPNLNPTVKCIIKQEYLFIIQLLITNPTMNSHQVMTDNDIEFWTIKMIR